MISEQHVAAISIADKYELLLIDDNPPTNRIRILSFRDSMLSKFLTNRSIFYFFPC